MTAAAEYLARVSPFADHCRAVATVGLSLIAAYGVGAPFAAPLLGPAAKKLPGPSFRLFALTLGLCVLGLLCLVVGAGGGVTSRTVPIAAVAFAALGGVFAWRRRAAMVPSRTPFVIVFAMTAGLVVLTVWPALCYPVGWDELTYHIAVPYRWADDGAPWVYRDNPYSAFPSLVELLFWPLIQLGGLEAPRLLNFAVWVLAALALFHRLRDGLGLTASAMLTAAFALAPIVLMIGSQTYVETFSLLFLASALALTAAFREAEKTTLWRAALAFGVLAGGAMAVKLTGVGAALAIAVLASPIAFRSQDRRATALFYAVFVLAAIMLACPFYLRAWGAVGNPSYPFYADWFAASAAAGRVSRYHHALGAVKFGIDGFVGFFWSPVLLAVPLDRFVRTFDGSFGWQGLVALAGFLAVPFFRRRSNDRPVFTAEWTAAVCLYVFWFFTARQARFLVPAFFMTMVQAAIVFRPTSFRFARVALALLAVGTLLGFSSRQIRHYWTSARTALGRVPIDAYFRAGVGPGYVDALRAVSAKTPADARVLFLFENRGLYSPRDYRLGTPFAQEMFFADPTALGDPVRVREELRAAGVTHILVGLTLKNPDWLPEYLAQCRPLAATLAALAETDRWRILWNDRGFLLYELSPPPARR